ncbi:MULTISPECIES: hypothetical protein [Desulfitobacterium]|uniref:Uncharacterized protein n=1 Tax=Desulfitobacterium chlororespirans DSM 11544 TaxID=1121395 RepID=A0A1M7UUB9_9FIRM|nr:MULTISPECIES: hypothetical protein [Desulfitobacterium]SHN86534.1 hypothetical protein SAMN02745215_04657 [Desulfitobacterium chlororespirans DSM 11544]
MAIYTVIECDSCSNTLDSVGATPKYLMIKKAREKGWSVGKQIRCSDCKKHKKEDGKDAQEK